MVRGFMFSVDVAAVIALSTIGAFAAKNAQKFVKDGTWRLKTIIRTEGS